MHPRRVGTARWRENFEEKFQDDQMHEDLARLGCSNCGTLLDEDDACPRCALHEQEEVGWE